MRELGAELNANEQDVHLLHGDVSEKLTSVEAGSIQLVLTSPPYNLGKEYERESRLTLDQYIAWLEPIVDSICNKVSDTGSICWQVGNFVKEGEVFPLDYYFYNMFTRNGFKLRNRIIWQFNFGLHASRRLSGRYETLLWFSKTDSYTFNLDSIRVPQLYPGKRHSSKKSEALAGTPSGNPLGKNPTDYWTFSGDQFFRETPVWHIPNVKANHPERTAHPCQFPHELAARCVLAFSKPDDTILDPFIGVGTTAIAALGAGRKVVGIDKDAEYLALTRQRIRDLRQGRLPLRPSGQPVRRPKSGEAVAQIPIEWTESQK